MYLLLKQFLFHIYVHNVLTMNRKVTSNLKEVNEKATDKQCRDTTETHILRFIVVLYAILVPISTPNYAI